MKKYESPGSPERYKAPATSDANAHAALIIPQDADATSPWHCAAPSLSCHGGKRITSRALGDGMIQKEELSEAQAKSTWPDTPSCTPNLKEISIVMKTKTIEATTTLRSLMRLSPWTMIGRHGRRNWTASKRALTESHSMIGICVQCINPWGECWNVSGFFGIFRSREIQS